GRGSSAWPHPAAAGRGGGGRGGRWSASPSARRGAPPGGAIPSGAFPRSPRRGEAAGSAQLPARVLIKAQMSGFGGEAEILCSKPRAKRGLLYMATQHGRTRVPLGALGHLERGRPRPPSASAPCLAVHHSRPPLGGVAIGAHMLGVSRHCERRG